MNELESNLSAKALKELQSYFPQQRYSVQIADRLLYAHDASSYRIIPSGIVSPINNQEIQWLFSWASRFNHSLTFRAAGTSLSGQAVGSGLIVDCSKHWKDITVHDEGNSITVQPGCIGSKVNYALKSWNRKIGPDPASINSCMMGGIIANNSSGMCCGVIHNSYHTVENLECVLPNGYIIHTASNDSDTLFKQHAPNIYDELISIRNYILENEELIQRIRHKYAIKNTVGYCLNAFLDEQSPAKIVGKLMIGSEGTLGFISKATLTTIPDLPYKATALLLFPTVYDACLAIESLKNTGIAALEIMDRSALRSVEDAKGAPHILTQLPEDGTALLAEYHAINQEELHNYINNCIQNFSSYRLIHNPVFTSDDTERAQLWKIRKGMFPSVGAKRAKGTGIINEDIAVPVEYLPDVIKDLRELFAIYQYNEAIIFGHAKDGNLHFVVSHSFSTQQDIDHFGAFMEDLALLIIHKYHGSLKAEHGTGRNIAAFVQDEWGSDLYNIMKRLKSAFDPLSILNPGVLISDDPKSHTQFLKPFPIIHDIIDTCIECGYCEATCPTSMTTLSARQRIVLEREIALASSPIIIKELQEYKAYQSIDSCANDGLCSMACPVGINTGTFVREERKRLLSEQEYNSHIKEVASISKRDNSIQRSLSMGRLAEKIIGPAMLKGITQLVHPILHNPIWINNLPKPLTFPLAYDSSKTSSPSIYYIPTCTSRLFAKSDGRKKSIQQLMIEIAKKAGISLIIPNNLQDRCCGMAYYSKGNEKAADIAYGGFMKDIPFDSIVLSDSMSCSYHIMKKEQFHSIHTLTFIDSILPLLELQQIPGTAIIHPSCSVQVNDDLDLITRISKACSEKVFIPESTGCCGFAGDHGFYHPEITIQALLETKKEISTIAEVNGYYSVNATCEIGMNLGTEKPYESLLYLIAQAAGISV